MSGGFIPMIYCDMDGVLVDFGAAAAKLVNSYLKDDPKHVVHAILEASGQTFVTNEDLEKPEYRAIKGHKTIPEARELMLTLVKAAGKDWWANLPWMPGGKTLWKGLKKFNPTILTAPLSAAVGCCEGKEEWVWKNLGSNVPVICEDEKWAYAGPGKILVDDFVSNTVPWKKYGGTPVLHKAPAAKKTLDKVDSKLLS
jgi:hypothetical protein